MIRFIFLNLNVHIHNLRCECTLRLSDGPVIPTRESSHRTVTDSAAVNPDSRRGLQIDFLTGCQTVYLESMCGRYGRRADKQRIAEWMQAHDTGVFNDSYFAPSFYVAPQSMQPIVRLDSETGQRELTIMRWGLVPFWSKDGKAGYSTINARAETLTTSPAFREAFKRRRCLVPADFFYEWQKVDAKTKQPYAIALKDGDLFAFAGLWETWKDKATGKSLETYTIVTTNPNEVMEPLHNRMPVMLHQQDYERWMAPVDPAQLPVDLLRPYEADCMKAWKVGQDVGNVRNNNPALVEPVSGK